MTAFRALGLLDVALLLATAGCDAEVRVQESDAGVVTASRAEQHYLNGLHAHFDIAQPSQCTVEAEAGSCSFSYCDHRIIPERRVTAGAITISSETFTGTMAEKPPRYEPFFPGVPMYLPGEKVTLSGAGSADVPAFSGTLTAPPAAEVLVMPDEVGGDSDATLEWTAAGEGTALVTLRQYLDVTMMEKTGQSSHYDMGPVYQEVSCEFEVGDNTGVIPAALLAELTPSPPPVTHEPADKAWLDVRTVATKVVRRERWSIELRLETYATADGWEVYARRIPIR